MIFCLKYDRDRTAAIARGSRSTPVAPTVTRSVEERAAVGDAAQRIGQRIDLVAHLGALFRKIELQKCHDHGEQQRAESRQREGQAGLIKRSAVRSDRRQQRRRHTRQQHRRVGEQHDDARPARHQRLFAAAPELLGGQQRQCRHHGRDHDDAQIELWLRRPECGTRPNHDRRREQNEQRLDLAAHRRTGARRSRSGRS